jgi:OmcA/MtrC family decaheme c-type cytochrome
LWSHGDARVYHDASELLCPKNEAWRRSRDGRDGRNVGRIIDTEAAVTTSLKQVCLATLFASVASLLAGCNNDSGSTFPPPPPPPSVPVEVPTGTSPITITVNTPPATFAALQLKVNVGRIDIQGGPPVVHFSITDLDDNGVIGFGSTSKTATATVASYPNLSFALAKLVPAQNGSPSKWVNYIVTSVPSTTSPAAPSRPSTDNTGTLVDYKNGTYAYTFYRDVTTMKATIAGMTVSPPNDVADLGDLTYEPTAVHRLTIQVSGNAPGTGTNTPDGVQIVPPVVMTNPVDAIHDFIPATGLAPGPSDASREIVATAKCNECHKQLGGIPGDAPESSGAGFHGGGRNDTRYCVVCHTDQRKYGRTEATIDAATLTFTSSTNLVDGRAIGNMPNHIHKTHMGQFLQKKNYDYGGLIYNETLFPQDIRNCTKCHDGSATSTAPTAQGDNWKNVPSRLACGACHDGIDFATGKGVTIADAMKGLVSSPAGHLGGAQPDDSLCASCHKPDAIDVAHLPVTAPNPTNALAIDGGNSNTNAAWVASNTSRMPAGAIAVTYEIQSVALNASRQPVMVFRLLQGGARQDFNPPPPPGSSTSVLAHSEMWSGFFGSPSVQYVFSVPQDGIADRTDFNASASSYLRSIWNGTATGSGAGTLTGPDADGFYTVTLTGVTIPTTAAMLTGGLGFSYSVLKTPPLTQANLAQYPTSPATATAGLVATMPNLQGGLVVIAPTVAMAATGFSARRAIVEDARCDQCHQQLGAFTTETFHGGQRNDATTCSWCHTPNRTSSGWSADSSSFVHAIHAAAKRVVPFTWDAASTTESFANVKFPGILAQCETCHLPGTYDFLNADAAAALPFKQFRTVATGIFDPTTPLDEFTMSPYVALNVDYGNGFSYSVTSGTTTEAAATTLVNSPIATACFACHDTDIARSHMAVNGGSVYAPRGGALPVLEQCMICHGPGRIADIKVVHGID